MEIAAVAAVAVPVPAAGHSTAGWGPSDAILRGSSAVSAGGLGVQRGTGSVGLAAAPGGVLRLPPAAAALQGPAAGRSLLRRTAAVRNANGWLLTEDAWLGTGMVSSTARAAQENACVGCRWGMQPAAAGS